MRRPPSSSVPVPVPVPEADRGRPTRRARGALALRVWWSWALVVVALRRHELPEAVVAITPRRAARAVHPVPRLSHATDRCTRVGPWQARCLVTALVLYRLLQSQGDAAELVIGLVPAARDHLAHAWVEVDGRVVGPPPGRAGHRELVRYPA